jgi:hypothetical protein
MEAEELREYQDRWRAVVAVEREEQRQASVESRWRQLNRLLAMAAALGLKMNASQGDVDTVRRRWNRLKDLSQSRPQG